MNTFGIHTKGQMLSGGQQAKIAVLMQKVLKGIDLKGFSPTLPFRSPFVLVNMTKCLGFGPRSGCPAGKRGPEQGWHGLLGCKEGCGYGKHLAERALQLCK